MMAALQRELLASSRQKKQQGQKRRLQQKPLKEWLDTQRRIDELVQRLQQQPQSMHTHLEKDVGDKDQKQNHNAADDDDDDDAQLPLPPLQLTIVQTTGRAPLRCLSLFQVLQNQKHSVQSLSLVGFGPHMQADDSLVAEALAQAVLVSPGLISLEITSLSIAKSTLLSSLCQVLVTPESTLNKLLLQFNEEEQEVSFDTQNSTGQSSSLNSAMSSPVYSNTKSLLRALTRCRNLQSLCLFGLNLSLFETTDLVTLIRDGPLSLHELRIVQCQLCHVTQLCQAIYDTQVQRRNHHYHQHHHHFWTSIDLSINQIQHSQAIVPLLRTPGLKKLSVSSNRMNNNDDNADYNEFCQALAQNNTLQDFDITLNPWSSAFGQDLCQVLRRDNTTLLRLSVDSFKVLVGQTTKDALSPACLKQLRHWVALNEAGRQLLRQEPKALPLLLARVRQEPNLMYGLLLEQQQYKRTQL
ncbi:hypothetical protein ACA910_002448 [Epithemia clementina (nom. ined.)]